MKKYQIIYADPPWEYEFGKTSQRRVSNHYDLIKLDTLCRFPVSNICDKDCALLMWTTFPKLEESFQVIKSWGFKYKTGLFTWIKMNKKTTDTLFWGMGNYTRSNAEICLLSIKGKPLPRYSRSIHSVIQSPIQEHSKKPDEARKRIEELFGDVSRIELFARTKTPGWDVWGNEVESDIALERNK